MNIDEIMRWVMPLSNFALAVYVFVSNRNTAKDKELRVLEQQLTRLEERVENLPDHTALASISGDMKAMRAELTGLKDVIQPLSRSLDRINDYLLEKK